MERASLRSLTAGVSRPDVVVLRALPGMGDLLCALPALRALRQDLPAARVTLLSVPESQALAARFRHVLDDFLEFPGYPGVPERDVDLGRLRSFLDRMSHRPFDLAIQLHGNGLRTNPFLALLGATRMAGHYLPGQYCPDQSSFRHYPGVGHEIHRLLGLMTWLGTPSTGAHLEFPLTHAELEGAASLLGQAGAHDSYVVLHAGASDPHRRWPWRRFAIVGDTLSQMGERVVLTGSHSEAELAARVGAAMHSAAINLAGKTDAGLLGAVVAGARLVVCNDTGVSHLAAALRTRSVVIFSRASNRERWAPIDGALHVALGGRSPSPLTDHRCLRDACERAVDGMTSMTDVGVQEVVDAVRRQLQRPAANLNIIGTER